MQEGKSAARPEVVDLMEYGIDLNRSGHSAFVKPDYSSATRGLDGVLSWTPPGRSGVFGGLAVMEAGGDHGGERHMDGEELIVALDGTLRVALLGEDGTVTSEVRLVANQGYLVPQGVWHRVVPEGHCRFMFFGGGRTEIRGV